MFHLEQTIYLLSLKIFSCKLINYMKIELKCILIKNYSNNKGFVFELSKNLRILFFKLQTPV